MSSRARERFKLVAQRRNYSKDELMEADDLEEIYEFLGTKLGKDTGRGD